MGKKAECGADRSPIVSSVQVTHLLLQGESLREAPVVGDRRLSWDSSVGDQQVSLVCALSLFYTETHH